ncbi:MAG: (2Fe-2S)-binding protein [Planctomycetes bacterium]|nr:(2Fe-2S)-binding protein [Planctomycetota bacterium]
MTLRVRLNGRDLLLDVDPQRRLLDVLRDELRLTGSKEGCGEGECGACTVLLDGEPVCSCLVPAGQVDGSEIMTVEGLGDGELLSAVQDALVRFGGTQCGICTPGIAVCATAALRREPDASAERLRELLAGNLCRCTGYQLVIDALCAAARPAAGPSGEGAP